MMVRAICMPKPSSFDRLRRAGAVCTIKLKGLFRSMLPCGEVILFFDLELTITIKKVVFLRGGNL